MVVLVAGSVISSHLSPISPLEASTCVHQMLNGKGSISTRDRAMGIGSVVQTFFCLFLDRSTAFAMSLVGSTIFIGFLTESVVFVILDAPMVGPKLWMPKILHLIRIQLRHRAPEKQQ